VHPAQVQPPPVHGPERLKVNSNERGFVVVLAVDERELSIPRQRAALLGLRLIVAP